MSDNNLYTVAFYNLENLFDTINDPNILDQDYTEDGRLQWDDDRYENKIYKLSKAIAHIGAKTLSAPPTLLGVAEVENKKVLNDLIATEALADANYNYIHYNSPDERGIDTALLYQAATFEVVRSKAIPLLVYNEEGIRDYTRDILHVFGKLYGEEIHVFVNHWPSRRQGAGETDYKRIAAAKTLHTVIDQIRVQEENPKFIIMGDFNDDPHSPSVKEHLVTSNFYNPMEKLLIPDERGSLTHNFSWNVFDQIIISTNFFDAYRSKLTFLNADILDEHFLTEWEEKYKGFPFRTYVGTKYLGGYSDHFPVFIQLKKS
ncbi:endonuclease/exonuclease/phosphatase family protein [Galbibacter orientalis]|uniref:Putative extracellular nuclease n=1 Tax=Galbibacter orientalis DSM 19592 TaxID=926559 RepID=I3C4A8_9FLAO|nr:endonuclease [Galbibacter orientalis]EIJ38451.1 putative extracellular nuclease [Galbibacter orientalis DSM 19592]